MALNFLLTQIPEPELGLSPESEEMTEEQTCQLASYFPVRSRFDEMWVFDRPNMIALWYPVSPFNSKAPAFQLKARRGKDLDELEAHFQGLG